MCWARDAWRAIKSQKLLSSRSRDAKLANNGRHTLEISAVAHHHSVAMNVRSEKLKIKFNWRAERRA